MIFSENPVPTIKEFSSLMKQTDLLLNKNAKKHEAYYANRNDKKLEEDVCNAIKESAKGTVFENSIQLISGVRFPDIVVQDIIAKKFYGVEVKSTNKNNWTSTGSSILESTRIENVERIFMTFGKLGKPVEFRSKPYEECLSEIAVTHYPRYKIDMNLKKGETIFDKMQISYEELRKMENPVIPVSKYYKSKLKSGESLWWASDTMEKPEEEGVPFTVKLFSNLDREKKDELRVLLTVFFPSILGKNKSKYANPALWLLVHKGIISTNIRDEFSAGGQVPLKNQKGILINMPAIFGRIAKHKKLIIETIDYASTSSLAENWNVKIDNENRLLQWIALCAENYACGNTGLYNIAYSVLCKIFSIYEMQEDTQILSVANN